MPLIGHSPAERERYGETPYDWGTIFASAPVFRDDEIQIYYGAGDWHFSNGATGTSRWQRLGPMAGRATSQSLLRRRR